MKKNLVIILGGVVTVLLIVLFACLLYPTFNPVQSVDVSGVIQEEEIGLRPNPKKKILYVDSYHEGYPWSDGITKGIRTILNARETVELHIERMDTKRNTAEEYIKAAALKVKRTIEDWNPDVVIASDDNASKYLITPYYINRQRPFVFCGLNGDFSTYGFPAENVTGMLEISLMAQLRDSLAKYARGGRTGYLAPDTYTDRQAFEQNRKVSQINFTEVVFVKTYEEWQDEYLRLQSAVDTLIIPNHVGITGFDLDHARQFTRQQTAIPTGSIMKLMSSLALITYAKVPEEQGEWAATRALQILDGARPADIAVTYNKKAKIYLNYQLAENLALHFDQDLIGMSSDITTKQHDDHGGIDGKSNQERTLNILTHEIPVMGEPTLIHAGQYEDLTGIRVNVHLVPFSKLFQEAVQGLKTSKYDIVFYGSLWIADMYTFLEPVPDSLLNLEHFTDILPHYKFLAKWGDTTYQVNIDGDRHYLQYRKDLLTDPRYREEFQETFGRPLEVPKTWKELEEIAGFFHGRTLENGKVIYGIAEITNKDDLLFSQFLKRAASYAKHPDIRDGFYFELESMKPLINTPGFVEALQDFVNIQKYYPKGGDRFQLSDVIVSFGSGEVVFSDCWDDSFIQAMEKNSGISDKVGTALSPGSRKVWNRKAGKWDWFPGGNQVPYFAWGWTSAVSKTSPNKQAAFDYLGFFSNNDNHFTDLLVGRYGVNPYRKADLNTSFWVERAGWPKSVATSYVDTLKNMKESDNWLVDLRIYKSRQYMNALAIGVYRALTGRDTPQKALDEVARRWELITESVGRDKQRAAYMQLVDFENQKNKSELAK